MILFVPCFFTWSCNKHFIYDGILLLEDEDEDDESSDESDSDESDFDDEDEEGREVLDDSVCPPGCEQELYDMSCRLRETRLDIEEQLAEEKKTYDIMKKDADSMTKKTKVIDHSLAAAEKDLEDFQVEKQGKLNQLQIIVILKMHQIEYLISNVLPNDLSEALVFERNGLIRLQNRIHELNDEKAQQSRKQKFDEFNFKDDFNNCDFILLQRKQIAECSAEKRPQDVVE